MKKAVIYSRVSTEKQDYQRQVNDLQDFAQKNGFEVVKVFSEKISGTQKIAKRKEASELFEFVEANQIKLVLVSEISRLGRSAIDVQNTIDKLINDLKVNIYVKQQAFFLLDEKGKYTALSKMFVDMLANFAQMERETLVERINSGLSEAKRKGIVLGRPKESKKKDLDFLKENKKALEQLKNGQSIRNTAKICDIAPGTVVKVKKMAVALGQL
jgi:DNA invertase Pin-like site-specific DNA recombinase